MPRPFDFNDHVLLVGQTDSGKTTLARHLVSRMRPQLRVVDPKGRLRLGVPPVRDVRRLDFSQRVVHFIPAAYTRQEYEDVYRAFYLAGGPAVVWTDEAGGVGPTTGNYAPQYMIAIQAQGHELGIGHLVCSQRFLNIAVPLRSEASDIFVLAPPPNLNDLRALGLEMGRSPDELAQRMRGLQAREGVGPERKFCFLWWKRSTGELADCAPIPTRT